MSQKDIALTPEAAQKLGEAIVRRRVECGYRSARKLGLEADLDYRTITSLEGARRSSVSRSTLAVLELKLDLPSGFFTTMAAGGATPAETVELDVPTGSSPESVAQARAVAQAAFNAALSHMQSTGLRVD